MQNASCKNSKHHFSEAQAHKIVESVYLYLLIVEELKIGWELKNIDGQSENNVMT